MLVSAQPTCLPVIWRLLDGKPGHQNQVLGLTEAIQRQSAAVCIDVEVAEQLSRFRCLIPGRAGILRKVPKPDLLVGAGHSTHLPLLVLSRRYGGRTVVLMKPSIPMIAFDLCMVASVHALRSVPPNVLITEGTINRVIPSGTLSDQLGLVLIGGPSSHFIWSDEKVMLQLCVLSAGDDVQWTITTSRRTPDSFLKAWSAAHLPGNLVPWQQTSGNWVPEMLNRAGRVWVTSDSMSMIYEALTAGARVGVLELPHPRGSRVSRSVQQLIVSRAVTGWTEWAGGQELSGVSEPLREADRCAREVIRRFLPQRTFSECAA